MFIGHTDLLPNNTYTGGTRSTIRCNTGFHISAVTRKSPFSWNVVCEENGIWVPNPTKCIPDDNGKFRFLYMRVSPSVII